MTTRKKTTAAVSKNGSQPKRQLREFQFVIQPVLLLFEGDQTPRSFNTDPKVLTGLDELRAFVDAFPAELANLNNSLETE